MIIKRKVSNADLNEIFSHANDYYRNDQILPSMDSQQYRAQCFTKAVCMFLNIEGLEFPVKPNCEPIDDIVEYVKPEPKEPPPKKP